MMKFPKFIRFQMKISQSSRGARTTVVYRISNRDPKPIWSFLLKIMIFHRTIRFYRSLGHSEHTQTISDCFPSILMRSDRRRWIWEAISMDFDQNHLQIPIEPTVGRQAEISDFSIFVSLSRFYSPSPRARRALQSWIYHNHMVLPGSYWQIYFKLYHVAMPVHNIASTRSKFPGLL